MHRSLESELCLPNNQNTRLQVKKEEDENTDPKSGSLHSNGNNSRRVTPNRNQSNQITSNNSLVLKERPRLFLIQILGRGYAPFYANMFLISTRKRYPQPAYFPDRTLKSIQTRRNTCIRLRKTLKNGHPHTFGHMPLRVKRYSTTFVRHVHAF